MNKKLLTKSTVVALVGLFAAPAMAELSLSGWINQEVSYLDNGDSSELVSNAGNGTTLGSRITFAGSTDLPGGYTAGFDVTLEPLTVGQVLGAGSTCDIGACGDLNGDFINVLGHSLNFAGGFGKVTMGLQSMPTDNIAVLEDPSLTLWSSISPVFANNAASLTGDPAFTGSGLTPGDFLQCYTVPGLFIGIDCNGIYRQGVRYDLPTFVDGLGIAVGWANDDVYDVAGKYKTAFGRVNAQIAVGYAENHGVGNSITSDNLQIQAGFMDNAGSGLFGSVAYQREETDVVGTDSTDAYWIKAGIKRAFNSLGDTSIAGQFGMYNDQFFNI
ncbi:MAG: porin, partial [Gammaproteobacteria bacterium]|nr:porin [Gammaproteobacteria bacterium]NIN62707.1 porin [Gammaproteobacteria bacterium]NIO63245.1 porin [Gammaproteobacteria bacterium]NIQ20345.1 porin [Gammaproteobacteria bacterium]NIT06536.1 porin [Gammaproteobacteria bacterium]